MKFKFKLSHAAKSGTLFTFGYLLFALPPVIAIADNQPLILLASLATLPLGYLVIKESSRHGVLNLMEGVNDGIKAGLDGYFGSGKFEAAMHDGWKSSCAALAREADAVGEKALAVGYRALGGVPELFQVGGDVVMFRNNGQIALSSGNGVADAQCEVVWPLMITNNFLGTTVLNDPTIDSDYSEVRYQPRGEDQVVAALWMIKGTICNEDPFDFPQSGLARALFPNAK